MSHLYRLFDQLFHRKLGLVGALAVIIVNFEIFPLGPRIRLFINGELVPMMMMSQEVAAFLVEVRAKLRDYESLPG